MGTVASDRVAWVTAFERTRDAAATCQRFGISRVTLRKWWRRYEFHGLPGLEDASRAPRRSPGQKVFEAEAARIAGLRVSGLSLARIRSTLLAEDGVDVSLPTIRKVLARVGETTPIVGNPGVENAMTALSLFTATLPQDAVFRGLSAQIAQGQMRPGDRLTEDRLCRAFGVGRTRVRQALRSLAMIGMVQIERNRGAVVATPSSESVADAYAARRLVEAGVVRGLAARRDPTHVAALRHHLRQQSDAERRGDKVALVRLLTEFHLLLSSLAGNPFVRGFVETLATTTSLAVLLYDQSDAPSCAVEEHRQMVRLIEAGEGDAAAHLMECHLGQNQQRLRQPGEGRTGLPEQVA